MKSALLIRTVVAIFLVVGKREGFAQGTFVNLDFEYLVPPLVQGPDGQVPITNAIPGWTGYFNGFPYDRVFYDTVALGDAATSIHDSASHFFDPIQGAYSVFIQGSNPFEGGPPRSAAIGQTGKVPANAASLQFWAAPLSDLQVTFGAQTIPMFQLGSTANYVIWGGDVSASVGQTAELRFTALANAGGYFDNIFFSIQPIPEPGASCLLGLGALLLGWRFLCKRT